MDSEGSADRALDDLVSLLAEVDRLRDAFATAWQNSATPRLEDFLPAHDAEAYELALLALIGVERNQRRQRGHSSNLSDWIARFPQAGELIREHWPQLAPRPGPDPASPDAQEASGESLATHGGKIGSLELLERVGEGRTSLLHRCAAKQGECPSVIRILRNDFLKRLPEGDRLTWIAQWIHAQEALARRRPPGMVQVLETGQEGEHIFARLVWMEGAAIEPGAMPRDPETIARLLKSAAKALQAAHAIDLVHGAVRPSKLLRSGGGLQIGGQELTRAYRGLCDAWRTGNRGIRTFLAPELFHSADNATPASDVFSLGAILYLLLANRPPYGDLDATASPPDFPTSRPIPLRRLNPQAGRELEQVAHRCLAAAPRERYPDLAALAADLEEAIDRLGGSGQKGGRGGYLGWLWGR